MSSKVSVEAMLSLVISLVVVISSYSVVASDTKSNKEDIEKLAKAQRQQLQINATTAVDITKIKKDQEYIKERIKEQSTNSKETLQILRRLVEHK